METVEALKTKYHGRSETDLIAIIARLTSENFQLRRMLFSSRSERAKADPVGMDLLFNEVEEISSQPEKEDTEAKEEPTDKGDKPKKNRGKRRPLPDHLHRERIEIDLKESEKTCPIHNQALLKVGEDITETLEIVPAKVFVNQNVVMIYKCPCCESGFHRPEKPAALIPKSFATPSLLSYVATAKFVDGLPLYRQERIFDRIGIDLTRGTMARWMLQVGEAVQPLIQLLHEDLLNTSVIHMDETVIQVLKEQHRPAESKSYMWCLARQGISPIIFYRYYPSRGKSCAVDLLPDYKGTIVSDGYNVYDRIGSLNIILAACMAHVRRKFWEAEKIAKKEAKKGTEILASAALRFIRELYAIEESIKDDPPDYRLKIRQEKSVPILEKFQNWLIQTSTDILPSSPTGKAIAYARGQWHKLCRFSQDGNVPIDNNFIEAHIRPFVIGRNNWMFADTPAGADASANIYTLVETAKANCIDPHGYLTLIFKELPRSPTADALEKLLPYHAKKHYELKPYQPSK